MKPAMVRKMMAVVTVAALGAAWPGGGAGAPDESAANRPVMPGAAVRFPATAGRGAGAVSGHRSVSPLSRSPQGRISGGKSETETGDARPLFAGRRVRTVPVRPPVLPLAFVELPGDDRLTPQQARDFVSVQDAFIGALAGEDPASPGYRRRWPGAQSLADQQLRARIGGQAFAARRRAADAARP